jgi:tetratricopeptide (TPR) repeat protein
MDEEPGKRTQRARGAALDLDRLRGYSTLVSQPFDLSGEALWDQAIELAWAGRYNAALERAREYETWAAGLKSSAGREHHTARANLQIGSLLARMGYFDEARPRLTRALQATDVTDALDAVLAYLDISNSEAEAAPIEAVLADIEATVASWNGTEALRMADQCAYVRARLSHLKAGPEQAAPHYAELVESPNLLPAERLQVRVQYARARRWTDGAFDAEQEGRMAVAEAQQVGDLRLGILARSGLAAALLDEGAHVEAKTILTDLVRELNGTGLLGILADVCNSLGELERHLGNADNARAWYERSVALWEKLGSPTSAGYPRFNLLFLMLDAGQIEGAAEHIAQLRVWAKTQKRHLTRSVELQHIRLLALQGSMEEAALALSSTFPPGKQIMEVDDALSLEWLVEHFVDLPAHRRPPGVIYAAAEALNLAEDLWDRTDRGEDMLRVRGLRARLAQLMAS